MRIMIVTMDYPPPMGGIQTVTKNLEEDLKSNGNDVRLVNFDGRNTSNLKKLRLADIFYTPATKHEYYGFTRLFQPRNLLNPSGFRDFVYNNLIYRETKRIREIFKPDITHIMKPTLFPAIYKCPEPYVVSCHGEELRHDFPIIYSLSHASRIHCVSNYSRELVERIISNGPPIDVIYNSVTVPKNHPKINDRPYVILTCCRLVKRKNIDSVLRAIALLPVRLKDKYQYWIIGEGPEKKYLMTLTKKLGLTNTTFFGQTEESDKFRSFQQARLFVLCPKPFMNQHENNEEGFGITFLEAQAAGMPVIGSRIGGIPEAVGDGGYLVEDPTNPQEIANLIRDILESPQKYTAAQSYAINRIHHFARKETFNQFETFYQKVIHENVNRKVAAASFIRPI